MLSLSIGQRNKIKPRGACLFIHDEVPKMPLAQVFDPTKHSLDPLKNINQRGARELADVLYTAVPQGENTLTVRQGKRDLAKALYKADRFDLIKTKSDEVAAMIDDLLFLPLLRHALCGRKQVFSLKRDTTILVRLNRAEIGDFAALVLGLTLINMFKGQIIIPDFGFYGRDAHISLVRENRLIAGVQFLDQLPLRLRQALLLIKDKHASHALYDDAVLLAKYRGYSPGTNEFNDDVRASMS